MSIRPATIAQDTYGHGLNRRVKKHIDSQAQTEPDGVDVYRHFFYNVGWQIVETRKTTTEAAAPQDLEPEYQYIWSARYIDAPILRDKNTDDDGLCDDERIYYTTDANMNVVGLFDTSAVALEHYVYDAYGHILHIYDGDWSTSDDDQIGDYANNILFAGYYRDYETGFYHVRNRMYHPRLGRWNQRDPVGYVDGMSLYAYVEGRPTRETDSLGLSGDDFTKIAKRIEALEATLKDVQEIEGAVDEIKGLIDKVETLKTAYKAYSGDAEAAQALGKKGVENILSKVDTAIKNVGGAGAAGAALVVQKAVIDLQAGHAIVMAAQRIVNRNLACVRCHNNQGTHCVGDRWEGDPPAMYYYLDGLLGWTQGRMKHIVSCRFEKLSTGAVQLQALVAVQRGGVIWVACE